MKAREFANTKLVVFDIDDTLVNTDTRVNVVRDGEVVKQLNSHDFTHYKLQPGEEFDFGRFRDAREFYTNARPIAPMIDRLRRDIATGNKVIMLTARADFNDRDVFLDTFRKYGIDMNRVHVYRAGNLQTRAATEEKKKIILQHLLDKQHYDKVIMYDDSVPNLNAFLTLSSDFPWSRFYAWHVDPNGRATEYHRSGLREDSDTENLPSVARAQQAIPQILARAQRDYDDWDEEDRDTYAGGGICHIIADSVCDVLSDAGIECTSVSCSHEQHVYVAARFAEGVYTIDIPYHIYEQGGGFSWKKLPDVRFEPRDVVFYRVSGDPADWRDYLDEGLRDIVNYIRNIGSEQDAPIVMMTNPQNTGARTASGQRMRIEDFPLKTVAVSELKPWEPMIKMQDLPSRRTVASLMQTLRQGGRIPPLLVTPVRGGYRIIDGHHRYFALQQAGIDQAPVRVVDPRLIRYSDEVMEALKITLERYGHLAVKEQAEVEGEINLGPQLFVSRQTTTEDIKPRGVAWTSTAHKTLKGFTSDWIEWCKDNMAQWVTDTGILYDVAPGARILLVRTDRDVIRVARRYGLEIKNSFDLFEKMDWDVLRQDYDAVHHIPQGRSPFMSAWDVESTAWFDRKFLTNPRRVTVDTGKTQSGRKMDTQRMAEGIDPDTFEDLDARIIARAAKRIVPTARARRTPDGYVHVTTEDGLDLYIGAGVADGVISVNIGSGGGVTTSGAHKGAVTDIIRGVYLAAVRKYGEPDTPGELTIDHDAGHGVWQHIADKLGLRYAAVEVKESGMAEGRISDLDIDLQDQQWEAVVGRVEHGVRRGEDPDGMSLALYQWATGEMFDMDEELERRGFGSVADLADHIRDQGGRYVPPEFDLSAGGSIKDIERLPRRRPDDVSEATSEPDFMRGHCHVMALALLTLHPDWQLRAHIGWEDDANDDSDYRVDHVYVMAPDGTAYDCRGKFASEQELVGPDDTGGSETQFVDYDISRMRADVARGELRPFSRRDLKKARAFAQRMDENFADGKIKGKSRPGRVRRAGASCKGSVTDLRARAKKYGGERGKMYHWCANMKSGKKNK